MELRKHCPSGGGYHALARRGENGMRYIDFGLLRLEGGQKHGTATGDSEAALIILGGSCSIRAGAETYPRLGSRTTVFGGRATSLYLPRRTSYEISAETAVEVAVCTAPASRTTSLSLRGPEDVVVRSLGKDNWSREAHLLIDERIDGEYLFVGEAFVPSGNWASYPPHRHERDDLPHEVEMEELYLFRFDPRQGFGIQKVYTDDGSIDETYTIENDDTVIIPRGYHPVVVAPGYSMYYLWVMAGRERKFITRAESRHGWLLQK